MQTITSVQVLRAIAALSVVACHYGLFYSQSLGDPKAITALAFGEAGVDLFFVISGFIMVYASQTLYGQPGGPMTFFIRRVIRIVPIYWLVTTAYLLLAIALPGFEKGRDADFVIASYLFIPFPRPDGSMQPLVGQGWTLNYEMLFYAMFAVAVFAPRRTAVAAASLIVGVIGVTGYLVAFTNPILEFWTNPIIIEFAFGMLIGLAYLEGFRLPRWLGWTLVLGGLALFLASMQMRDLFGGRLLPWGLPAAAAVAGATLGGATLSGAVWSGFVLIGETSYALYLTHTLAVRGLIALFGRLGIDLPFWPGLGLALVLSVALAIAVYYAFERPLTRALRNVAATRAKRKSVAPMVA